MVQGLLTETLVGYNKLVYKTRDTDYFMRPSFDIKTTENHQDLEQLELGIDTEPVAYKTEEEYKTALQTSELWDIKIRRVEDYSSIFRSTSLERQLKLYRAKLNPLLDDLFQFTQELKQQEEQERQEEEKQKRERKAEAKKAKQAQNANQELVYYYLGGV